MQKKWVILIIIALALPLGLLVYNKFFNHRAIIISRMGELAGLLCKTGQESEILAAVKAKKTSSFFSEKAVLLLDEAEPELEGRDLIMALIHNIRQNTATLTVVLKSMKFTSFTKSQAVLQVDASAEAKDSSGSVQKENRSFDVTFSRIEGSWLIIRAAQSSPDDNTGKAE